MVVAVVVVAGVRGWRGKEITTGEKIPCPSSPLVSRFRFRSVPIGAGDDPHMTGSLSQLVLELSAVATGGEVSSFKVSRTGLRDAACARRN